VVPGQTYGTENSGVTSTVNEVPRECSLEGHVARCCINDWNSDQINLYFFCAFEVVHNKNFSNDSRIK
jgi:hypothetical protein